MILGARRSTPIISLQAEAHIPSLELQRGFLSVKILTKLSYKPKGKSSVDNLSASNNEYTENLYPVNSFMRRSIFWCKILGIYIKRVHDDIVCDVPPWEVNAQIITSYDESHVYNNQTFLNYIDAEYRHFKSCFTDGSKIKGDNPVVGSAIYFPHGRVGCTYRLHPSESVIFSELFAVKLALEFIEQHTKESHVIFTDSKSALQLIASCPKTYVNVVTEIKKILGRLNRQRQVVLHWIRGHTQIMGNEIADKLAKKAVTNDRSVYHRLLKEVVLSLLNVKFLEYWDQQWKCDVQYTGKGSDLYKVRDNIRQKIQIRELKCRRYEKILYRIRLGHVGLKKCLYRIGIADSAMCSYCNSQMEETIEHYLFYCVGFYEQRCSMYTNLRKLDIQQINLRVILGAEEKYNGIVKNILLILMKYVCDTKRLSDI